MTLPDPITATVALLLASTKITDLVGQRVYGAELPKEAASSMPQAVIVVRPAPGGIPRRGCMPLGDTHYDMWCYGEYPSEAGAVRLAVYDVLKNMVRTLQSGSLLYNYIPVSSPIYLRDLDTDSPFFMQTFQLTAAECPV